MIFDVLLAEVHALDGWSPIGHSVIVVPEAPDPDSPPRTRG